MCGCMVGIQSAAAEIRRGKKTEDRKKPQDENIMVCPIPQGDHKKMLYFPPHLTSASRYSNKIVLTGKTRNP